MQDQAAGPQTGAPPPGHLPRLDALLIASAAVLSAVGYSVVAARLTAPGFPLDDAWIHLQFARNVADGLGFSFNPGVPSSGSTAPLWTLLLAVPALLGLPAVASAKVIGTSLSVVTALSAARITAVLTGSRLGALIAGLAVALSARITWGSVSGMEVPLYSALVTLAILAYLQALGRGGGAVWAVLAGLAGTARPEAFVLAPILFVHWMWWHGRGVPIRTPLRAATRPAAAIAAVLCGYVLFNVVAGGHPLPATFHAKSGGQGLLHALAAGNWDAVRQSVLTDPLVVVSAMLRWMHEQSPFLSFGVLIGALVVTGVLPTRGGRSSGGIVVLAMLLAAPVAKGMLVPLPAFLMHEGRYAMHLLVLYFILGAAGLAYLWERTGRHWAVGAFVVLTIARLASQDVKYAPRYAAQVKNINDLQVATGAWIGAHTTPDAIVATNDIGALAYFGGRFLIDIEGLVTPDAVPFNRRHDLVSYLDRTKPDLLIIFPGWYPELSARPDLFEEIDRVTSTPVVIAGGESLVIYRTPWTRADAVRIP